jgi:hypothetical protein
MPAGIRIPDRPVLSLKAVLVELLQHPKDNDDDDDDDGDFKPTFRDYLSTPSSNLTHKDRTHR